MKSFHDVVAIYFFLGRNPGFLFGGKVNITVVGNFTVGLGFQWSACYLTEDAVSRRINMNRTRIRAMVVVNGKTLSIQSLIICYIFIMLAVF